MSQTNVIVGTLFLMFVIYITAKGKLPTYISLIL